MSSILRTIGIDISKDWLDAFASPEGRASRFSNDAAGFRKLIAWIGSEVDRIAYEPTGPFHRDFEDTLLKAGLPLYAINPFQVRSFARSLGRRAKTDAVDARTTGVRRRRGSSSACPVAAGGDWARRHWRPAIGGPSLAKIAPPERKPGSADNRAAGGVEEQAGRAVPGPNGRGRPRMRRRRRRGGRCRPRPLGGGGERFVRLLDQGGRTRRPRSGRGG